MFVVAPNVTSEVWVRAAVAPWASGDPPDYSIDLQKSKTWARVYNEETFDGELSERPFLIRAFCDVDVYVFGAGDRFDTGAEQTYFRLAGDDRFWYALLDSDPIFDSGILQAQYLVLARTWDGVAGH